MRVLRQGMMGTDVRAWQTFLVGQDSLTEEVTGEFDQATLLATQDFQKVHELDADGVVGNQTLGQAMLLGFVVADDRDDSESGPLWPPRPTDLDPLSPGDRDALFGKFSYVAAPISYNPEGISIQGTWVRDQILPVRIPQLGRRVLGVPPSEVVSFHRLAVPQLLALWQAWEDAGLLGLVLSWGGSWAPRFVRGSRTTLSNHAYGTAFDINAGFNALSTQPALVGQKGSVRKLVELANQHGFWWGGFWGYPGLTGNNVNLGSHTGRSDGMHFEVADLK